MVDTTSPVLLPGVRADDALLDSLGGRDTTQADALTDDDLNALLLAWRREVDARPVGVLVDTPRAVRTIRRAARARRWDRLTRYLNRVTRRTR
jgi:hypothetical protein